MTKNSNSLKFILISLLFLGHAWLFRSFFVDDSYITFRFVRQWTHGNGLVYNIGERVEGYSNFLWVVLLAPFDLLRIDLVVASKTMGMVLGLLILLVSYRFARRFVHPEVPVVLLAASGPFAAWAMGGLETLLFSFLLTLSATCFLIEQETKQGWWSGLTFGLLALTRPDGAIFAGVAVLFRGWTLFSERRKPDQRDILWLLVLVGIVLVYFGWRLAYYGLLIPNTVYAKSTGLHPRPLIEGFFYLYQNFAAIGGYFVLILPLALLIARKDWLPLSQYLGLNLAAYAFFAIIGGGDWMPQQRFLVHILPLLYLLVHQGLLHLQNLADRPLAPALLTVVVAGQVGFLLFHSLEQRFINGVGQGPVIAEPSDRVVYLQQNVSADMVLAVVDAGHNAYVLPLETRVVVMGGLTDAHIAHLPAQFPNGLFGRGDAFGKWDIDYILAQEPDIVQVVLLDQTNDDDLQTNFTGTTLLINDVRFRRNYEPLPEESLMGLFIRKQNDP